MSSPMRPVGPSGRPVVSFRHVRPPSVVLKMPPFGPPLSKRHGSVAVDEFRRQGILPDDHRWAKYQIDGDELGGQGPYKVVAEFKAQMVPVNLLIAIMKVGFDYNLDARTIARRVVDGYADEQGNPTIWNPESADPEDNKVIGNEVLYRREAMIEVGS